MTNRLASSTSPYLLQHAENPVDWWPWGPEAFDEARRRDSPVLLSVGYSACHWCHVMAHDSFENAEVAGVMNEHFVSIKVDREERPDIDAVYMDATTALTGQGGWPMTCLLAPDGSPFFAGTFFPRAQFVALLRSAASAWERDRDAVLAAGQRIVDALTAASKQAAAAVASAIPDAAGLHAAAAALIAQADGVNGGFGSAPKFPPSMVLEFLLRHHERTGSAESLAVAGETFEAMARGGMYDQLASGGTPGNEAVGAGGGFARYSVDAAWVVPHFEKMLYDNALLLRAYLHWWRLTGSALGGRIARETAEFLVRDLLTEQGGFASSLDADTGGVEGLTYVWTPAQLADALGDRGTVAAELFGVTAAGTFEHGASTLQLRRDPDDPGEWAELRSLLLAARARRPQPARDDKVVAAWNGLAIAALAEAAVLFAEPRYLSAATTAAELLLDVHLVGGRLRRTSRDGAVGEALAVAEDYGDLADGLLVLHQATGSARWLVAAGDLLDFALAHFAAAGSGGPAGPTGSAGSSGSGGDRFTGGFFDTGDDAEALVRRPRDPTDNATPSGSSALITALLAYSALTGSLEHRAAAEAALGAVGELAERHPRFAGWALAAAEALLSGPVQVAVAREPAGTANQPGGTAAQLSRTAWWYRPPGAVVLAGPPDAPGLPLLAGRPLVDGAAAAYVCRGMVCDRPVTSADDLRRALTAR